MSPRVFIGWVVAAVAMVALAIVVVVGESTAEFDPTSGEPAFPALRADPDAAARITVANRFTTFTVVRKAADQWVAPDRYDYPVDAAEARELVVKLADMRILERKTRRADRYTRLEVEDYEAEESASRYVRIENRDGTVLAEAILGRPSFRYTTGGTHGTYFRRPGDDQSWLGTGVARVQERLIPWLDRDIVSLTADTVRRLELAIGTPGAFTVERPAADAARFAIADVPAGREVDPDGPIQRIGRAMAEVRLEDLKPAGEVTLPGDGRHTARVETFDGLAVTVEMAKFGDEVWARFHADFVGDPEAEGAAAARERAAAINARVAPWAYWVPTTLFEQLARPLEEFLVTPAKDDDTS